MFSSRPTIEMRGALSAVLDLVVPPGCAVCQGEVVAQPQGVLLCATCRQELIATASARRCGRCATVLTQGDVLQPRDDCYACRRHAVRFDAAVALATYDGALRTALLRSKQSGAEPLALALGGLLAEVRRSELDALRAELIVPVPLHWWRRWQHGTNNAERIATRLGQMLQVPIARRLVRRVRATRPQQELTRTQRDANVKGAFAVRDPGQCTGRRVLIVDDILTSGATCRAIARTLSQAGAASVGVAAVGRAHFERD